MGLFWKKTEMYQKNYPFVDAITGDLIKFDPTGKIFKIDILDILLGISGYILEILTPF